MMEKERDYQKDIEICEKATPGEWAWNTMGDMVSISGNAKDSVVITIEHYDGPQIAIHENNDIFITTARTALPWYIRRCMELETEVGRLKEAVTTIMRFDSLAEEMNEALSQKAGDRYEKMQTVVEAAKEAYDFLEIRALAPDVTDKLEEALAEMEGGGGE